MRGRTVAPRSTLPPWLAGGGAGDNVPAMIAALQADSAVVAYWDGRRHVSDIAGKAQAWGVEHSDVGAIPDIVAASAGARPDYDGVGLTFDGSLNVHRMLTAADPALDILSAGGSLLMLGSIDGATNRILASVRNASTRFLELGCSTGAGTELYSFCSTSGGQSSLNFGTIPVSATRRALACSYDPADTGVELAGRAMNAARVAMGRDGFVLAEDAWVELGARAGAIFGEGTINAIALLDAPFTPGQMVTWRDFGVEDFGISTL